MSNQFCKITGLPKVNENPNFEGKPNCYWVNLEKLSYTVNLTPDCYKYLESNELDRRIVTGLVLNGALRNNVILCIHESIPDISYRDIFRERKNLKEWLNENIWPKTDLEKVEFALEKIQKLIGRMGASFVFDRQDPWYKMFFCHDQEEFNFILKTLRNQGLIEIIDKPIGPDGLPIKTGQIFPQRVNLTYDGISYLNKKQKEVQKDLCFVAMSFGDSEKPIYTEAIEPAIEAAGYQARRVDDTDHHIDKEQTINDSILALAKKANFVVCDYTGNKRGVYFEHGYAWGLSKKVIMTCKDPEIQKREWIASGKDEKDFDPLHFDVRNYPFIMWTDLADLRTRLQAKIESWIGKFEP